MDEIFKLILDKMPLGVIVFGQELDVVYRNRQAEKFLRRHTPPEEMTSITRRLFDAIFSGRLRELFPGEVYLSRKLESSPSVWVFRFAVRATPDPLVCVFIREESVSGSLDLNETRQQFGLTRRETDVLRLVLDGLKNSDIAEDLEVSEQTVKDHLSKIYMKIGVGNRFDLARALWSP